MIRTLFVMIVTLFVPQAMAQTGTWKGRQYTPDSFPRAEWCQCSMCVSLRAQWARYEAKPAITRPGPAVSLPIKPGPTTLPSEVNYRLETRTVYETRYRTVKRCYGSYCKMVTEAYQVPVTKTVRVPIVAQPVQQSAAKPETKPAPEPKPDPLRVTELIETPLPVVEAMLRILAPPRGSVYFDIGSGDGRFLAAAAEYEVTAIGIELDAERAKQSRDDLSDLPHTTVFAGNALVMDLSGARYVSMYLYPELMAKVVEKLPDGAEIVSYAHEIPGVECERHVVVVDGREELIWYGRKGRSVDKNLITFGL